MIKFSKSEVVSCGVFVALLVSTIISYEMGLDKFIQITIASFSFVALLNFARHIIKEQGRGVGPTATLLPYFNSIYIAVSCLLMVTTVGQIVLNNLDLLVPLTLGGMIISKGLGFIYPVNL